MALKRSRDDYDQVESQIAMANYLIMLSQGLNTAVSTYKERVFECKTCNRQFPSFQALGGHRASHKRLKSSTSSSTTTYDHHIHHPTNNQTHEKVVTGPKVHECTICGSTFSIGQALGGHMRRHRAALSGSSHLPSSSHHQPVDSSSSLSSSSLSCDHFEMKRDDYDDGVLSLDLNLTPHENGLLKVKRVNPIFA